MKRIITLIMCSILVVCSIVFVSADASTETVDTLSLSKKQMNAVEANNALLNHFINNSEIKSRSADFEYSDCFPDYYGGSYIDSNGDLVILIVDKVMRSTFAIDTVSEIANNPIIKNCEYSYTELKDIMAQIASILEPIEKSKALYSGQVKCWAIDDEKNCIYVYLKDLNDEVITWFKNNVCNSNCIVFKQSNNVAEDDVNLSGQGVSSSAGDFSAAFRVRRSTTEGYKYGFITCAHGNSLGTVVYGYDGTRIGTVTLRRLGGAYDISYVEMENSNDFINTITGSPYELYNSNENIDFPTKGMPVYLYARHTKGSFGIITSTDVGAFTYDGVAFSGFPGATYSRQSGDSGGLVCSGPTNITCEAIGVHRGTYQQYSIFTSAVNVVNLWYLNRY
ncbi:MAG: hypothetical protein IJ451_05660 [Ruminococcus sp.]|nr:hypothetical protein [Ruminococcus sp.]